ncbi:MULTISPECIES: hypothetical protein [unclassified Streptomyces]|uniref:hypothetical protein n=1 Tax=unclassified Streptomyces TaxID=2593676 RepID=UPI0021090AE7|nr:MULTISPECIES: hypothetical protein [unclassified Streptomyces]
MNNAGSYRRVAWQDTDETAWNYSLDVNLTANYPPATCSPPVGSNAAGAGS